MSQHVPDSWSPELGPVDLACCLEVTGYPKTRVCRVSEMVAEGEGTGSGWFFFSKFRQNGVAKSLADTVTHRSHFEQPQGPWEDASGKTWFHALKRRRAPGSPAEGAAVR